MKVAIVGGNFLGCATAHYVRRALDAKKGPAGDDDAANADDIVIFERSASLGGNKFSVTRHGSNDFLTGSACDADLSTAPLFNYLLCDAGIEPPQRVPCRDWAIFDWDKDQYRISSVRSLLLSALASSRTFCVLFHVVMLSSSAFFSNLLRLNMLRLFFRTISDVHATLFGFWLAFLIFSGFGLVPFPLVVKVWNWMIITKLTDLSAKFTYGTAPDVAREITLQFRDHMSVIRDNDSASSAITVGHLMSCCGMAKYAKASASEVLDKFHVGERIREELISPGLAFDYAESRFKATHVANGVATMLNMMTRLQLPTALRRRVRNLTVNSTKTLCPKLTSAARARLQVCTEVLGVCRSEDGFYELRCRTSNGETFHSGFDAVILAAVVNPDRFDAKSVLDSDIADGLGLASDIRASDTLASFLPNGKPRRNTTRYMSLISGRLRPSYFRVSRPSAVAASITILNGINCGAVDRVGPETYRVLSADEMKEDSDLTKELFESVDRISSWKRKPSAYVASPLRNINNGRDVPTIILGKQFINAAATDRVANHVEMDCMSARNSASFFKEGVVLWK